MWMKTIITRKVLREIENKLARLRNTFPCGIRSIDDARDEQIARLVEQIAHAQIIPEYRVSKAFAVE